MIDYIISTERLGLRTWIESDIDPFVQMNEDKEVMKYFLKTLSHSESVEMMKRIQLHFQNNGFGLYAVEHKETKQFIGFTGFSIPTFDASFTPCIEIGWRFKKEFWRQGLATEAALACLTYGFDILNFDQIVSFTSVLNVNSEKVMKRIGMTFQEYFDHPKVENNNPLLRHVLYTIDNANRISHFQKLQNLTKK